MNRAQFTNIMLGNLDRVAAKTGLEQNVLKDAISRIKPFEYTPSYTPPASTGAAPPAGSSAPSAAPQRQLSPQDQAALDWANAHPQDPRSEKIKQRLGIK